MARRRGHAILISSPLLTHRNAIGFTESLTVALRNLRDAEQNFSVRRTASVPPDALPCLYSKMRMYLCNPSTQYPPLDPDPPMKKSINPYHRFT